MNINFLDYQKKVLSQFGQDGVIEKIFELIKPVNKFFVEFGSNGRDDSQGNTAYMRSYGFDGLLMDGADSPYGIEGEKQYPVKIEFITVENIIELFKKYNVPKDLDFLSIDIDGNDYWILKEILTQYQPQVICIESNYCLPVEKWMVQKYNPDFVWGGDTRHGASYRALLSLGIKNKYSLVAICGCDMIFIKNESIPDNLTIENVNNIEKLITAKHSKEEMDSFKEYVFEWDNWIYNESIG